MDEEINYRKEKLERNIMKPSEIENEKYVMNYRIN